MPCCGNATGFSANLDAASGKCLFDPTKQILAEESLSRSSDVAEDGPQALAAAPVLAGGGLELATQGLETQTTKCYQSR